MPWAIVATGIAGVGLGLDLGEGFGVSPDDPPPPPPQPETRRTVANKPVRNRLPRPDANFPIAPITTIPLPSPCSGGGRIAIGNAIIAS